MCDFRYPYYSVGIHSGSRVKYIGNISDVKLERRGCYSFGHTGSITFYFDGEIQYSPGEQLPYGMYWKDDGRHHHENL